MKDRLGADMFTLCQRDTAKEEKPIEQTVRVKSPQNWECLVRQPACLRHVGPRERSLRKVQQSPPGLTSIASRAGDPDRFLQQPGVYLHFAERSVAAIRPQVSKRQA